MIMSWFDLALEFAKNHPIWTLIFINVVILVIHCPLLIKVLTKTSGFWYYVGLRMTKTYAEKQFRSVVALLNPNVPAWFPRYIAFFICLPFLYIWFYIRLYISIFEERKTPTGKERL